MPAKQKYLLIIDDTPVSPSLEEYFARFHYRIVQKPEFSLDGSRRPAALLINCALASPRIMGLCERMEVPVIMMNDRRDEELCIRMLESGADDFLVKPIHPRELHARITAINRRVKRFSRREPDREKEVMVFATWQLHPASRQVFDEHHQELLLSSGEYDLLLAFIHQPQQVLRREFLSRMTRNSDMNPLDRRIDVQISRLRQKIETDPKRPELIKTIRNEGYLFTAKVQFLAGKKQAQK